MRHGNEGMNKAFIAAACFKACSLLHNFLMDQNDMCLDSPFDDELPPIEEYGDEDDEWYEFCKHWRDEITFSMWNDFSNRSH